MSTDRENALPEGVIDADPPGGWESADTADAETAEQGRRADVGPVEGAALAQDTDPDLTTDEEDER